MFTRTGLVSWMCETALPRGLEQLEAQAARETGMQETWGCRKHGKTCGSGKRGLFFGATGRGTRDQEKEDKKKKDVPVEQKTENILGSKKQVVMKEDGSVEVLGGSDPSSGRGASKVTLVQDIPLEQTTLLKKRAVEHIGKELMHRGAHFAVMHAWAVHNALASTLVEVRYVEALKRDH